MNWPRVITGSILLVLSIAVPWWVALSVAFVAAFYFSRYVEFIVVAFIIDALYGAGTAAGLGFPYMITTAAALLFVIVETLKQYLIFYNRR